MNNIRVELLNYTPLHVASSAIRTCWASQEKSDSCIEDGIIVLGEKDKALIDRVGNKNKHSSTLEHLFYNFHIYGISRACLQELARHRMASLSVKSTRYTLKELKDEEHFLNGWCITDEFDDVDWNEDGYKRAEKYLMMTGDSRVDLCGIGALDNLRELLQMNISNDKAKYALPESYRTELAWSINARSLQNFLTLRLSPHALLEIRILAQKVLDSIPTDHLYLFEGLRVD